MLFSNANEWMRMARSFTGMYESAWEQLMQNNLRMADQWSSLVVDYNKANQDCGRSSSVCPPEPKCPPHCLAEIHREASPGEIIVVPFSIKNTCGKSRTYQIGIRPLVDEQGKPTPAQPSLDTSQISLEPGQAITVKMTLNLQEGFNRGETYSANIVIREDKVNQNVCFTLKMVSLNSTIEVRPLDEKHYLMRWSSWQDHFYCEQQPGRRAGDQG